MKSSRKPLSTTFVRYPSSLFLFLVLLVAATLLVHGVQATKFDDAKTSADRISKAINALTLPYDREFTMDQLETMGWIENASNTSRPYGTYKIRLKSASYNQSTGTLSLNMYAWHNNTSLKTHSPWNFYIPWVIAGSNNVQRLNSFLTLLALQIDNLPYGDPIGDDALTVYSADNSEAVSTYRGTNGDFSTIRSGDGTWVDGLTSVSSSGYYLLYSTTTSNEYDAMVRGIFLMNTSALPDDCTIDDAYLNIYVRVKGSGFSETAYVGITNGSVINTDAIQKDDYQRYGGTRLSTDKVATSLTSYAFNNWTLNSDGENSINKTGFSQFYLRSNFDIDDAPPTWASAKCAGITWALPYNGTEYRPYLYITYTPTGGCSAPNADFSVDDTTPTTAQEVTFTDSSTNTPTSWAWDFDNDGDTDSTDQNPNYTYSTPGNYTVNLTATNACGSDSETKTDYITVTASPTPTPTPTTTSEGLDFSVNWTLSRDLVNNVSFKFVPAVWDGLTEDLDALLAIVFFGGLLWVVFSITKRF